MSEVAEKKISIQAIIIIVVLITFLTNLKDVKQGFFDGWNEQKKEKVRES